MIFPGSTYHALISLAFGLTFGGMSTLAGENPSQVKVTYLRDDGKKFADPAGGPRFVQGEVSSGNFAFMPSLLPNPSVVLFDMSNVIGGRPEVFIPDSGQILGIFTDPLFPQPGKFSINLPIEPTGAWLDVDHDGVKEQGIQIYSLKVGSNLFGNSHLQQMEQEAFVQSYLTDFVTGEITEGIFLLFAPDDRQDFPAAPGNDGVWFSGDEPTVTLPAGYSLATLPPDGPITLDCSPRLTMGILERAETESPDFSAQGILKSFHSLIDILGERYAYTDLRQLDWETIRAAYLPRVKKANAEDDMAAYYVLLHELAVSLGDTHVVATTKNLALSRALYQGAQKTATVGADVFAVWGEDDELPGARIQVLSVGEKSPAQKAGWVPGTEILSIDGEPIADRVAAVRLPVGIGTETVRLDGQARNVLNFEEGQEVTIEFRLPGSSDTQSVTMTAGSYPKGGSTPPSAVRNPVSFRQIEDYGLVRWGDFLHYILPKLAVLEEALSVEQGRASGGIIIDLRGNSGGWVALYETMASYFFTAENPMPVGIFDEYFFDASQGKRVKVYSPDYKISAPNPDHAYSGPVVVLVDQTSASAAEYFSQHLQQLKRATIIGQYPTSGAGGSVERVTMPAGILFQFTQGGTFFAGTRTPNLEAKGVRPDVRVPATLKTELAKIRGEDPVLDAAIAFLDEHSDRLVGTTWRWTANIEMPSLKESPVKGDGIYEITFNRDGTLSVTADANRATGTYERKGYDQISISVETSTLALGPPESLGESFLASLGEVTGFAFDSRRLALIFPKSGNESFLMFEAAE